MTLNTRIFNRFEYYLEDCACMYCVNFRGETRKCKQSKCPCEDIKKSAVANGRIERKGGA